MAGLVLAITLSASTQAYADETEDANKTVVLNEKNKITYADGESEIADAFRDMAPGDEKTVVLRVENDSNHSASFFLSQETTSALEETTKATGGAYAYRLSVGTNPETAESLLDTIAGGYKENQKSRAAGFVGDSEGLAGITELENAIEKMLGTENFDTTAAVLMNERQYTCCQTAYNSLDEALEALKSGMTRDAINVNIDVAIENLDILTGEKATESVVNEIFSQFCVGK